MTLFSAGDLGDFLQQDVSAAAAATAEKIVSGWLQGAGVDVTVSPVPATVFSWALELGAIAYENPASKSTVVTGGQTDGYGQLQSERRAQILAAAAAATAGSTGATSATGPQGAFPLPSAWPEPARPYRW